MGTITTLTNSTLETAEHTHAGGKLEIKVAAQANFDGMLLHVQTKWKDGTYRTLPGEVHGKAFAKNYELEAQDVKVVAVKPGGFSADDASIPVQIGDNS